MSSVKDLFSGTYYHGEFNVRCPICDNDYTHIKRVCTLKGRDKYEAGIYPGTIE